MSSVKTISKYPYVGWVPTAIARLSFRHVGEARHPTESRYANIATSAERLVVGYQRRPLSDYLFQPVIHYIFRVEKSLWFAVAARSNDAPGSSDELKGTIFIYKSKNDWRTKADSTVRENIETMNASVSSFDLDREQKASDIFTSTVSLLVSTADICVEFCLDRNGVVYFGDPKFQDSELEYASVSYAEKFGHDFAKWTADQAYFFLRDISHRHQHHDPSSDTILILQQRKANDNVGWRRNIIFSLYYYIIRSKRFADASSLYQSAGVLAYTEAFKEIAKKALGSKFREIPEFNDAALRQSLQARADEEVTRAQRRETRSIARLTRAANNRTFALAFVAIVVAFLLALIQPAIDSERHPLLFEAGDIIAERLLVFVGVLVFVLVVTWAFTFRDWDVDTRLGRDLLEASNVRRKKATLIYGLLFVGLCVVTFWLGGAALEEVWKTVLAFSSLLPES